MLTLSQDTRLVKIDTPLGKDKFIVTELNGEENVSDLYQFDLQLQSNEKAINPQDLVGQEVTVSVEYRKGAPRYFHGVINNFSAYGMTAEGLRQYHATIVPSLWFLTLSGENRIFQNMTTCDIVSKILKDGGVKFEYKAGKFDTRAYCIQYEESDYDFVTRLLAEEGICFYFTHSEGSHSLVIADKNAQFVDCEESKVPFNDSETLNTDESRIIAWQRQYSFHTGEFGFSDYIESKPGSAKDNHISVPTKTKLKNIDKYVRNYYGSYVPYKREEDLIGHGSSFAIKKHSEVHIEAAEAQYDRATASSNCCSFTAGGRFTLEHSLLTDENDKYLITKVYHHAAQSADIEADYSNNFTCMPAKVPFRPAPKTSRKRIDGPHLAVVEEVKATESPGPADPQTQVKVKFLWDTEQASCMVRVAQSYAGKNWGAVFVPRVGQEVIVEFIGGDPDRPLITGSVYNATNKAPQYSKTQSGFKTESSAFNEFRFDDKGGSEEIYMEAGKDHNYLVHNDQTGTVENNQALTVLVNRDVKVDGDQSHLVKGNISKTSKKSISIEASQEILLKVGGNTITIDQSGISVKGTTVKINGQSMTEVKAGGMLTVKGSVTKIN